MQQNDTSTKSFFYEMVQQTKCHLTKCRISYRITTVSVKAKVVSLFLLIGAQVMVCLDPVYKICIFSGIEETNHKHPVHTDSYFQWDRRDKP